jgi:hypothetical protein
LSPAIRAAFDEYFIRFPNECLDDRLSGDDWGLIEKIQSFLSRLTHTTMSAQGADATLGKVIPQMDFILGTYENAKEQFKDDPIIATMINSGWSKMEKYYQLLEDTPAYIAATVLSPNLKWEYIESSWNEEWLPKAKEMMRKFWEDEYKPQDLTGFTCEPTSVTDNTFENWFSTVSAKPSPIDEYERYISLPQVFGRNIRERPWEWWLEPQQQTDYPNLSKMAIDVLSIPAMSDAPERLFSSAKQVITDRRNRMGIEAVEALECL